jgi:hypothetical protein
MTSTARCYVSLEAYQGTRLFEYRGHGFCLFGDLGSAGADEHRQRLKRFLYFAAHLYDLTREVMSAKNEWITKARFKPQFEKA